MPGESLRTVTNTLTEGALDADLKAWREDGVSYGSIAKLIAEKYRVDVTDETVRQWCKTLNGNTPEEAP